MRTREMLTVAAAGLSFVLVSAAHAQHAGDVGINIIDNHIVTGSYNLGVFTPGQRVFGAEFGELFPNFTDEPGFDSLPGTFPTTSSISFNVLAALRLWEGDHFGNLIPAVQISIGFGPVTPVLTPLTDVITPGFSLAVGSNGEWHRHLQYTLQAPAPDGIYLLQMNLVGDDPTMQASLPFWLVFNQNRPEAEHDAAIEWANQNLVPAPGVGAALLAVGGCFGFRRRRTHAAA